MQKHTEELKRICGTTRNPSHSYIARSRRIPSRSSLFVGFGGMHGCYAANMALYEVDLLINIGARFDDRLTGNLKHFAPNATVAHIDIDPAEIGKNVPDENSSCWQMQKKH